MKVGSPKHQFLQEHKSDILQEDKEISKTSPTFQQVVQGRKELFDEKFQSDT